MITKQKNGLKWYESENLNELGVKHGFFTSLGGVSSAPFDSLNVVHGLGDPAESVNANRERILKVINAEELHFARLVHGVDIEIVSRSSKTGVAEIAGVDSLVATDKQVALGLSTADCLPIIISDGELVSVVHAGWRGTVDEIVVKTVKIMLNLGLNLDNSVAALGPYICQKHFEVRDEAARLLRAASRVDEKPNEPFYADLAMINEIQLQKTGIDVIEKLNICSFESEEFYSFREQNGKTGRNMTAALLS